MQERQDDTTRHAATFTEESRQDVDLSRFTLAIADVLPEFEKAGVPISERSLQRYCAKGLLRCIKVNPETRKPTNGVYGDFLIDPQSVTPRIEALLEKKIFKEPTRGDSGAYVRDQSRTVEPGRDWSRQDAAQQSGLQELEAELEETKDKLQDALTQAAGHKAVALQMRKDRDEFQAQIRLTDRAVGVLQHRLMKLGGDPTFPQLPDPERPNADDGAGEGDNFTPENGGRPVQ